MHRRYSAALLAISAALVLPAPAAATGAADPLDPIVANDNRKPAGTLSDGRLVLHLRAARGEWKPEGEQGPVLTTESFGELAGPLQVPAPLLRVQEGTEVAATVRNDLDLPLRVSGLCARDGSTCAPLDVPASEERQVRFLAGRPGTYYYWATTTGMPLAFRAVDTQLSGAFVVDPAGDAAPPDRVLVITEWTSLSRSQLRELAAAADVGALFRQMNPRFTFLINGLAWPAAERLTYRLGDDIRWRVLNLTTQSHPMHLHGFFFDVTSLGNGAQDRTIDTASRQHVVTHLLPPGGTMAMSWTAERPGNWLFHCHIAEHIAPERRLAATESDHSGHGTHVDGSAGMAGMALGITIVDQARPTVPSAPPPAARSVTVLMQSEPNRFGGKPAYGFALDTDGESLPGALSIPGPTLTVQRGEPVEITLVNRLQEPTAIHWHGIELESYYDGVHGWSGAGSRLTPIIEPGERFTVRFTPPRTGTFIYHTHLHDDHQLASGMYGAVVVLDPGETFDPATDHVIVIGRGGPGIDAPVVLNGDPSLLLSWKAGVRHRVRLINITPGDILVASLSAADSPATWRPLSKDGAPVPPSLGGARPAVQTIAVGETYDFEYDAPPGRQSLWLEVRSTAGRWMTQSRVVVR